MKDHSSTLQDLVPQHKEHASQLQSLRKQVTGLMDRMEDAKGRAQRNTIRVIELPERSKGNEAAM